MCIEILYIYLIYIYKKDLALYNLEWLIGHKAKTKQKKKKIITNVSRKC